MASFVDRLTGNVRQNVLSNLSSNIMNNLIILVSFGIIVYILVQMIIVLNKPEFLYYTLSPMPTDLSNTEFKSLQNSEKMPKMIANEFTYSFWVYLRSINQEVGEEDKYKLVFTRSEDDDDSIFTNANPIVYFDQNSNKLIVKIRTTDVDSSTATANNVIPTNSISAATDFHNDECLYSTLSIDYVPLKRWVNVIINVDNNRVTLFVDGDIYDTLLVNNQIEGCNISPSRSVSDTSGDIKLGSNDNVTVPDALISKIQFFNYSIKTPSDIRKIYDNGPVESQNFLQKLGIPNLGLRNPIYNIEDTCDS